MMRSSSDAVSKMACSSRYALATVTWPKGRFAFGPASRRSLRHRRMAASSISPMARSPNARNRWLRRRPVYSSAVRAPSRRSREIKAARCARRGSAPALGLRLGRPGRARRPDTAARCLTNRAHPARTRSAALPGPSSAGRAARCSRAGYPSGGIVGRPGLAGFRPLPSPRPDSQASIAAGGPVTSTGGLVPMCSMP